MKKESPMVNDAAGVIGVCLACIRTAASAFHLEIMFFHKKQ